MKNLADLADLVDLADMCPTMLTPVKLVYGAQSVFNYCKYRYQRQACFFEIYCFYFFTVIFTNTFFYMEVIHMKMLVVRYHTVQYPVL